MTPYYKIGQDFKWFFDNGYITHRDGNYCERLEDNTFWVTASAVNKSILQENDFVMVNELGQRVGDGVKRPSIETMGHIVALNNTNKNASLHVHSPNTVALFLLARKNNELISLERAFNESWPEFFRYTKLGPTMPYHAPGSKELHQAIATSFSDKSVAIAVMERHGIITTGISHQECRENCQRLEHLSEMLLKVAMASSDFRSVVDE